MPDATPPPVMPARTTLGALRSKHPDYNACQIEEFEALYEGGEKFRALARRFLVMRQIEKQSGQKPTDPRNSAEMYTENPLKSLGSTYGAGVVSDNYEERLAHLWYIPVASGVIDFNVSSVMYAKPQILASAGAKKTKSLADTLKDLLPSFFGAESTQNERTEYWNSLNTNFDGAGNSLTMVMYDLFVSLNLHSRAYLAIIFPDVDAGSEDAAKSTGKYNARGVIKHVRDVWDWERDERGELLWVKVHRERNIRGDPTQPCEVVEHIWAYYHKDAVYTYRASWPKDKPLPDETVISVSITPHDLGALPIKEVTVRKGLWVMNRIAPAAIKLLNRENSTTMALDDLAFALLVIATNKKLEDLVFPTLAAIKLNPGQNETAAFISPNPQIIDVLRRDCEACQSSMFLTLLAMALIAAAQDNNGRQSGAAKERDLQALITFLRAFAEPATSAVNWFIKLNKNFRDDGDLMISMRGLDQFDIKSLQNKLADAAVFLGLPNIPESAKRWVGLDCSLAMTDGAPPEVREAIIDEAAQMPAVPAPAAPGAMDPIAQAGPTLAKTTIAAGV